MTPHEKIKKMNLLPENPTQFDYLHAIRAVAAREKDIEVIFTLADDAMGIPTNGLVLDNLCVEMLRIAALGGVDGGTDHLKASEVKKMLTPFFGEDRVKRCVNILCGRND